MRSGLRGVVAGVLAVLATAAAVDAATIRYDCRFGQDRQRGGGWIPEQLILTEDEATGRIIVFDPVILTFVGTPIEAELLDRTSVRATYKWEVRTRANGQSARMSYTFSWYSNGQPARITARPGGYDNSWTNDGKCVRSTG